MRSKLGGDHTVRVGWDGYVERESRPRQRFAFAGKMVTEKIAQRQHFEQICASLGREYGPADGGRRLQVSSHREAGESPRRSDWCSTQFPALKFLVGAGAVSVSWIGASLAYSLAKSYSRRLEGSPEQASRLAERLCVEIFFWMNMNERRVISIMFPGCMVRLLFFLLPSPPWGETQKFSWRYY